SNPKLTLFDPTITNTVSLQETVVLHSNPGLKPVSAENYGFGVVVSPKILPHLTVSVDYYHVKTVNDIFFFGANTEIQDLENNGSSSRFVELYQDTTGHHLTTTNANQITPLTYGILEQPQANAANIQTEGIDV